MTSHDLTRRNTILSLWRIFFGLIALQGLGVLVSYLQTRSETGLFLGFSRMRLVIVAGVLLLTAAAAWLFVGSLLFPVRFHQRAVGWADWLSRPVRWGYLTLLSGILLFISSYLLTLYPDITEPFTRGFIERLVPIIAWLTGACALFLILMIYLGRARGVPVPGPIPRSFWLFLAYFCAALLAWFWVSQTVLPIASSRVGWNQLGVPVLESQLVLAWGVGILALLLVDRLSAAGRTNGRLFDLVAVVLLWSCAAVFWQSTPISPNWFVSEKIPPNFAQYPYSDARVYDVAAQSALIGEGFKFFNGIDVRRPLHAAYLTILHLAAGQEYDRVIFLQVLILALLPVFVYLTVKSLHNRASGFVAAAFIIFREANSISIAGTITASHVKLIMVDLPTALIVMIFFYLSIRWLKQVEQRSFPALVAGGTLGLAMLIRLETAVLAFSPVLIASLALLPKKRFAWWVKNLALFSLGAALVISPWIGRNWQRTGQLFVDSPMFRYLLLVQRFQPIATSASPPPASPSAPGQEGAVPTTPASASILPTQVPGGLEAAGKNLVNESLKKPGELAGLFAAHYLNNQIQMLLIYPDAYRFFDNLIGLFGHRDLLKYSESSSLTDLIRRLPFWRKWDGSFPSQSILPVLFSVSMLAAGLSAAWRKQRLVGLMPALALVFFIGFYALLRNSGGRYILPVDWISILYFSIGLIAFSMAAIELAGRYRPREDFQAQLPSADTVSSPERLLKAPKFYLSVVFFLLLGVSIPLVERSFPLRYPPEREAKMLEALLGSETIPLNIRRDFEEFLVQGGTAMAGRALYPLFYPSGYGSPDPDEGPLMTKDYPRLVFNLTGEFSLDMALPMRKQPVEFKNASDALALFCLTSNPLRADPLALALFDQSGSLDGIFLRSPLPENSSCPLPPYSPKQ